MCRVLTTCAMSVVISCCSSVKVMHSAQLPRASWCLVLYRDHQVRYNQMFRLRISESKNYSTPLSNAARLPKEPCFLEGSDASAVCPSGKSSMYMNIHLRARAVRTLCWESNCGSLFSLILTKWFNLSYSWLIVHLPNKYAVSSACFRFYFVSGVSRDLCVTVCCRMWNPSYILVLRNCFISV